jgi:hypothetical protein
MGLFADYKADPAAIYAAADNPTRSMTEPGTNRAASSPPGW